MNQQESDIVAHVREKLGGLRGWLEMLERGVGNASRPAPAIATPTQVVTPHRLSPPPPPIKPLRDLDLEDTEIRDHEVAYAELAGYGRGSYYASRVRLARAVLAAERQHGDRLWIDLGGEA